MWYLYIGLIFCIYFSYVYYKDGSAISLKEVIELLFANIVLWPIVLYLIIKESDSFIVWKGRK